MSVFAVMLGVVLACVLSAGACLGAGFYLDPVADLTPLEWYGLSCDYNYDCVDDGADHDERYPDGNGDHDGNITAVQTGEDPFVDTYRMEYVGGEQRSGNNITKVKLWIFGHRKHWTSMPIYGRVRIDGGVWPAFKKFPIYRGQANRWASVEWTGGWTQDQIDDMEVQIRCATGVPVTVGVVYVEAIE